MQPFEESHRVAQDDRRSVSRRESEGAVELRLGPSRASARIENRSRDGLYLVLDSPLEIEVVERGEVTRAHIVRVSRLVAGRTGVGLELQGESVSDGTVADSDRRDPE